MSTVDHRANRLFIALAAFFLTNAIMAEFIGVKIFSLEASLGAAPFQWSLFGITGTGLRSPVNGNCQICEALTRLLAPIMTFTCEEVWQYLPKVEGRSDSVHAGCTARLRPLRVADPVTT